MRVDVLAKHWGNENGGADGMAVASSFLAWTLCELGHDVHGYLSGDASTPVPWTHPRMTWCPRTPLFAPDDFSADLVISSIHAIWRRTALAAERAGAGARLVYWHHYGTPPAGLGCWIATPSPATAQLREWLGVLTLPPSSWAAELGGETSFECVLVPNAGRAKGGPVALSVATQSRDLKWLVLPGRGSPSDLAPWRALGHVEVAPGVIRPDAFLSRTRAVLAPTQAETYGLALVEAAVRGAIIVCSDLPGPRFALGDVATYVAPNAPPAVWRAMLRKALGRPAARLQRPPYAEVVSGFLAAFAAARVPAPPPRAAAPVASRIAPALPPVTGSALLDVSVLLGTVNRPVMLRQCIESVRASLAGSGLTHEIVVAYGREDEPALPWMREQPDVVTVLGGMEGAIEAFNRAYDASRGRLICQINDDVLVDGNSLSRAAAHLDADSTPAGVVLKFDRLDGLGHRHEYLRGSLHPNQMVVRRETCEAVVERIGGFWGDAAHRTDKTYGGDSAFGAICHHLGLRLDSVEGVTCRDRLADDALRAANKVAPDHWNRWNSAYRPLLDGPVAVPRADEWPELYLPRPGMRPRRSPVEAGRPLRLLHLSLADAREPQTDMRRAFARIGPTVELPWIGREREAIEAARAHRPELVFAQIQGDNWSPEWIHALRDTAGPRALLCLWTGDVRTSSSQPVERWQARAGQLFDVMLADSCTYPKKWKRDEGATAACGYLQCGIDPNLNPFEGAAEPERGAVFMGTNYKHLDGGERERLMQAVSKALPGVLDVYGGGWRGVGGVDGHPFVEQSIASGIMRRAQAVISTSLFNDLERYTSDRLKRAMCSGAIVAVRRFPDMEGLGLVDGENCLFWNTPAELIALLREPRSSCIREAAARLARERFTQDVMVEELLAIIRDVRARKGLA